MLAALQPDFSYNRWDNYEIHTAIVTRAHSMLLSGSFPHLNPHQHLGEPLHAAMQCGALYLPYTLCLLLTKLLGLPVASFALVSAGVHAGAGSLGWMGLTQRLGVRAELAATVGVAAGLSGFGLIWAPLWLFTAPMMALIPWVLLAVLMTLERPGAVGPCGLLGVLLAAVLFVGYPTWGVYTWLFAGVFAVLWSRWALSRFLAVLSAVPGFLLGALLAAPFLVPALLFLRSTPRAGALSNDEVLRRSASPSVLTDLLLPVFHHANGFIGPRISIHLHIAGWLVPALLLGWLLRRDARGALRAGLAVGAATGLIFLLLSFGRLGGLLPLTLWVPVWSSFRWPFKFLPFAAVGLTLASACGLELVARAGGGRSTRLALVVSLLTSALLAGHVLGQGEPRTTGVTFGSIFGALAAVTGIVGMALAGALHRPRARHALLLLAPLHAVAMIGLAQVWGARGYRAPWGTVDASTLGVDESHRVLPLSDFPFQRDGSFEQFAVGHSASANGYLSATGTKTEGLMPSWYLDVFPTDHLGMVAPEIARPLVASSLLRGLAVRWYVVGRSDTDMVTFVSGHSSLRPHKLLGEAGVFEDEGALPRGWLAKRILPWTEEGMAALRSSALPAATALVPELNGERSPSRVGEVLEASWGEQDAQFSLDVPDGGVLVLAVTWNEGWSATVDGVPAEILRINGVASGVALLPGAKKVEVRYRTPGLTAGVTLAGVGGVGWLLLLLRASPSRRRRIERVEVSAAAEVD